MTGLVQRWDRLTVLFVVAVLGLVALAIHALMNG